jgi:hypothetical protein
MAEEPSTFECAYCGDEIEGDVDDQGVCTDPVQAVDDDEAWQEIARHHAEDCDWVLTRAHRRAGE